MDNLQKVMKYSLVFGLPGAALIPLFYEVYANISATVGLSLILIWALIAGIKFSSQKLKYAVLGVTACIAYTGVLGIVGYTVIHPVAVRFINSNSSYIHLSIEQQAWFLLYAAVIMLLMYVVCFSRRGILKAIALIKGNSDKAASYIRDAFLEDDGRDNRL